MGLHVPSGVYADVLPDELLQEVEWMKDDAVLYYPRITAVNASVIDEADHQTQIAASVAQDAIQRDDSVFGRNIPSGASPGTSICLATMLLNSQK
jgi:hypothetical protein